MLQFSDAISIIGREDFPDKWPTLLPEMVEKFNSGDFHIINGVLRTAHSIFKRYDELCTALYTRVSCATCSSKEIGRTHVYLVAKVASR